MQTKIIKLDEYRIEIGVKHKRKLCKEFQVTAQTVRQALDFVNNSNTALKIRARAKEMLQEEIVKIETIKVEY